MPADHDMTLASPMWQRHRAARTAAHHARDAQDLAEILAMLGLTAAEGREQPREQPEPAPRKPPPRLDPPSTCRLNNLLRNSGAAAPTKRPAMPR